MVNFNSVDKFSGLSDISAFALSLRSEGSILSPLKRTTIPLGFSSACGEEINTFLQHLLKVLSLQQELWLFKVAHLAVKSVIL